MNGIVITSVLILLRVWQIISVAVIVVVNIELVLELIVEHEHLIIRHGDSFVCSILIILEILHWLCLLIHVLFLHKGMVEVVDDVLVLVVGLLHLILVLLVLDCGCWVS